MAESVGRHCCARVRLGGDPASQDRVQGTVGQERRGRGFVHVSRRLVVRRRGVLVEIDVGVVEGPAHASANGPDACLARRPGKPEAGRPIVGRIVRPIESNDSRDVGGGTVLLRARTHRHRYVFVANTEVQGEIRTNTEIIVDKCRVLQEAKGNTAISPDADFAPGYSAKV